MRARVPLVKIVASALTIGTGGSGGREGPIAQIGAGFGSLLAKLLNMKAADRRILLAAGMGAGIAAIFRAPLAGALFAAEVLYRSPEFEPEVILPAGLASVVAYSTFGIIFALLDPKSSAWEPLFKTPLMDFRNPWQLIPYTILALAMPLCAMLYTRTFYWITYLFHTLRIPRMLKPALGAGLTGALGVALYYAFGGNQTVLSVMSFGYGVLQDAMRDHGLLNQPAEWKSVAVLLLAVAFGKMLTTSLTIGSGGSGGVFGPSMVIGGCAAGALMVVMRHVVESFAFVARRQRLRAAPGGFHDRRHGRLLRRRRQDAVLDAHHRLRTDRRLSTDRAGAVGLHYLIFALRRAVFVFFAGGRAHHFAGPSRGVPQRPIERLHRGTGARRGS